MRQEPSLSDLDSVETAPAAQQSAERQPVVVKRGAGVLAWLFILINLGGLGALGFLNLQLQGQAQVQGQTSTAGIESLNRRVIELEDNLQSLDRLLAQQQQVASELAERLDLQGAKGIAENAGAIQQLEANQVDAASNLAALESRIDTLVGALGQNTDRGQDMRSRVDSLAADVNQMVTRLGGVIARLDGQEALSDALNERVEQLPALVEAVNAKTDALEGSITATAEQLVSLEQGVLSNQQALEQGSSAVSPDDLLDLEAALGIATERLSQQSRQLIEINERLDAVDAFRAQTNQSIFGLEDRVRALQ